MQIYNDNYLRAINYFLSIRAVELDAGYSRVLQLEALSLGSDSLVTAYLLSEEIHDVNG